MISADDLTAAINNAISFEDKLRAWAANLGLDVTSSADKEYLSVRYDQRIADMRNPLVRECRGLIFHRLTGELVARPFAKFFNAHEDEAPQFSPHREVYATEKRDGSCVYAFLSDRDWRFATLGSPLAEGGLPFRTDNKIATFGELAKSLISTSKLQQLDARLRALYEKAEFSEQAAEKSQGFTLIFELTAPENRVVIQYTEPTLTLIGARDTVSGLEVAPWKLPEVAHNICDAVKGEWFPDWTSLEAALQSLNKADEICEGFVVCQDVIAQTSNSFLTRVAKRVKLKTQRYVRLHSLANNGHFSLLDAFNLILDKKADDVNISPMVELISEASVILQKGIEALEQVWARLPHEGSQKEFAKVVTAQQGPNGLLFLRRKTGQDFLTLLTNGTKAQREDFFSWAKGL